ncbi:MAG: hypothetical protein JSU90_08410 [Nitrospiraceae bacterium]|nr:MAG: hypothetical protein JSU90_08410 [Nitrospiraceae bacterium]
MKHGVRVFITLFLIMIMGGVCSLDALEHAPLDESPSEGQEAVSCERDNGTSTEIIKLNYVRAKETAGVLARLFSESAVILPFETTNSIIVKSRRRGCEGKIDQTGQEAR